MKITALVTACSRRLERVAILRRGSEEVSVRWHLSKDLKDLGEAMRATHWGRKGGAGRGTAHAKALRRECA